MKKAPFEIYSASAGSGKTFALVKEYLKICLTAPSNQKFTEILAITFTNKAASEMKERVIFCLVSFSNPKPVNCSAIEMMRLICKETGLAEGVVREKSLAIFYSILHNYSRFSIGTIDGFTHRIIRTFAQDLGLPQNFEVELNGELLKEQAVDLLISRTGGERKELTELLVSFIKEKTEDDKSWLIEKDFYAVANELFDENSRERCEELKKLTIKDFLKLKKSIVAFIKNINRKFNLIGKAYTDEMISGGIDAAWVSGGSRGITKYFLYLKQGEWQKYKPNNRVWENLWSDNWSSSVAPADSLAAVERLRIKMIPFCREIEELLCEYPKYIHLKFVDKTFYRVAVLNEISKEIGQIKEQNNIIPLSEFNKKINSILESEEGSFIYERLGEKYVNYFIDEFQDTSLLQWKNLLPLIENAIADGEKKGSTMVVGDAKQAIYRWRGGDVEQFIAVQKKAESSKKNSPYSSRLISLEHNYRSKAEIVEFNNNFFSFVSKKISTDKHSKLYKRLEAKNIQGGGGLVSFSFIEKGASYEEQQVARCLEKIEDLVDEGFNYADMCVLTRTRKKGALVVKSLSDRGVPVISSESLLIGSSTEAQFVVNFLRYLNEPEHPVHRFKLVEFLKEGGFCPWEEVETHTNLNHLCKGSKHFFNEFLSTCIENYKPLYWASLSLMELCHHIIKSTNLNSTARIYMQFFLEEVWVYETKNSQDIRGYIEYWETHGKKLSISIPEGVNAVQVMTIHKSKGLEFPVVLFPFADWDMWKEIDPKAWVKNNYQELLGLPSSLVSLNKLFLSGSEQLKDIYTENEASVLLDNINMLYVTLTRPEKRLYIFSSTRFDSNKRRLASFFKSFLEQEGLWREGAEKILIGQEKQPEKVFFPDMSLIQNTKTIKDFSKVLRLSRTAPESWSVHAPNASIENGNKVHEILSFIAHRKDLKPSVERAVREGFILNGEVVELIALLKSIIDNQTLKPYFCEGLKVKNECEIILNGGKALRPDRLVFDGNKVHVFDYKTGEEREEHINQINQYKNTLSGMGFDVKESFLVYIGKPKIKLIQVS